MTPHIKIKIETANNSFAGEEKNREIVRILYDIANQILYKGSDEYINVSDINGNHVGYYEVYNDE